MRDDLEVSTAKPASPVNDEVFCLTSCLFVERRSDRGRRLCETLYVGDQMPAVSRRLGCVFHIRLGSTKFNCVNRAICDTPEYAVRWISVPLGTSWYIHCDICALLSPLQPLKRSSFTGHFIRQGSNWSGRIGRPCRAQREAPSNDRPFAFSETCQLGITAKTYTRTHQTILNRC